MLVLDPRLEEAIDGLDEVLAVEARVEAEDRAAEHALENLPPPGADAEGFGVGPGDVPEGQDGRPRQAGADHRRQQREVVVLHQDDRILAARLLDDGIGEALVDVPVVLPVGFPEHRAHMGDMTQRPHAFVGEAVVVAPLLLGAEPDAPQDVFVAPGRHADPVVPVDDRPVGAAAAVRDPGARAGAHHRLDRRHQPAGGPPDHDAARTVLVDVGLPVRDDDDLVALQLGSQERAQPFRIPVGLRPLGASILVLQVAHAGADLGGERAPFPAWPSSAAAGPRRAAGRERRTPSRAS